MGNYKCDTSGITEMELQHFAELEAILDPDMFVKSPLEDVVGVLSNRGANENEIKDLFYDHMADCTGCMREFARYTHLYIALNEGVKPKN
jgi:hypothetical protein